MDVKKGVSKRSEIKTAENTYTGPYREYMTPTIHDTMFLYLFDLFHIWGYLIGNLAIITYTPPVTYIWISLCDLMSPAGLLCRHKWGRYLLSFNRATTLLASRFIPRLRTGECMSNIVSTKPRLMFHTRSVQSSDPDKINCTLNI